MASVLITGGAGFIGSHLTDRFLSEGHDVVGVDNFITGSSSNINHIKSDRYTFVEKDVSGGLDSLDRRFDYVLHFASPASPIDYLKYPVETLLAGSAGTHAALDLAVNNNAVFMIASTSEVYGDPHVHPQPESYWGNVNSVGPRSCYDEAKRYAEAATMAYHRARGLDVRILRIFNTYGPRMRVEDGRAVTNFACQALEGKQVTIYGDGSQTRSFCYISDLVDGIAKLLYSGETDPVNLGNTEETTILQIAETIIGITGSTSEIVFKPLPVDDPKQRQPDISRAREILGWEPKVSLEEGLKYTIKYYISEL